MWAFLNNSFLSAVAHRDQPDALMVRARLRGDIEAVFPDAEVSETPDADYRFRAVVPREQFADVIAETARSIDYSNFKNSVMDERRHDAYLRVWSVMHREQEAARL